MIQNYVTGPAPAYRISSVDHALQLAMLLWQSDTLRVSDAAEYLGVARSTAHRLLAMLVFRGFATQLGDTHRYIRGPVLSDAGTHAMTKLELQRAATPFLVRLAQETGETATLQMLEGCEVAFVDTVESTNSIRVGSRTGIKFPAYSSAGGKVLLSQLDEDEVVRLYPEERLEVIEPTARVATRDALLIELREIRRNSRAIDVRSSVIAAGVPVINSAGRAVAALGVAGPRTRVNKEAIRSLVGGLQNISTDLSAALAA